MKKTYAIAALSLLAAGCNEIPPETYFNRGSPESLLDMSSEVVNVRLDSPASLGELTNWIDQDQPSRAELSCMQGDPLCSQAEETLAQFGVPAQMLPSPDNSVTLYYERVLARDCENRYIDNRINPYNLNHPTFGCSTAANMVQMISDKRQITAPNLTDYADGEKAVQTYGDYMKPNQINRTFNVQQEFDPIVTKQKFSE